MDWLEEAVYGALAQLPVGVILHERGTSENTRAFLHYGVIDYKKASLPGDKLTITTTLAGRYDGGLAWSQSIQRTDSEEVIVQAETYWSWL